MKKYFILMLLASIVLLPSCKKPQPEVNEDGKILVETFNSCKDLPGARINDVTKSFLADGWIADTTSYDPSFYKQDGNIYRSIDLHFSYANADTTVHDFKYVISNMDNGDGFMKAEDMTVLTKHIGAQRTIRGELIDFTSLEYSNSNPEETNTETDYQKALESITKACTYEYMLMKWGPENNAIQIERVMENGHRTVKIEMGDVSRPQ